MSHQLLIGPAASGKTERCLRAILETPRPPEGRSVWILLPDRAQSVAFRRQLARRGGSLGVRTDTFQDLAEAILIEGDRPRPRASEPLRRRLIADALKGLNRSGRLPHYGAIADTPGLVHTFGERFAELRQAGWTGNRLRLELPDPSDATDELTEVLAGYESRLADIGWADAEGLLVQAAELLSRKPDLLARIGLVVVDGFHSLSPIQLQLLGAVAGAVPHLIVTLEGDDQSPARRAFHPLVKTRRELLAALPDLQVEYLGGSRLPSELGWLEGHLFEEESDPTETLPRGVQFLRTRDPVGEVREAYRWLKEKIIRRRLSAESCALILTDPERYAELAIDIADEYGLPIRLRMGRRLERAPATLALLDLLALPDGDWPRRLTLEAIRSPYFDLSSFGLGRKDALVLEAVSYWGQVVSGSDQWLEALTRLGNRSQWEFEPEDPAASMPLPDPEIALQLAAGLDDFFGRLQPPRPQGLAAWVRWLEDLLDDLGFFRVLEEEQEAAHSAPEPLERPGPNLPEEEEVGRRLREVLRSLVMAEAAAGGSPRPMSDFVAELRASLEGSRYRSRQQRKQARIHVLTTEQVKGLRFAAVAVVGLSEGQLPAVEREDPILDEDLRSRLGLEPRLLRAQENTFYHAVTRADNSLLLLRSTLAEDGERWQPSPYWQAALQVFGLQEDELSLVRPGDPTPLEEAASQEEVSFLAVRRGGLPASLKELKVRLEPLRRARSQLKARLAEAPFGPYEGDLRPEADHLAAVYAENHTWSPSRLESYSSCPHQFFASHLLELEQLEPPDLGPDARQLGTLLHEVLERAYREAADPADPAAVLDSLEELAGPMFDEAPTAYGFRASPLWQVEQEQLLASLRQTVEEIAREEDGWMPTHYERRFGLEGEPALEVNIAAGRVRVRGIIDRIDRRGDGRLRVIDYKTGGSHLGPIDLSRGRRLQLPLYALAAEHALGLGEVVDGFYWVIRGARAGGLRLERFYDRQEEGAGRGPEAAYRTLKRHLESTVRGVRSGSFPPIPPHGGCPSYCPAAGYCWRYSPSYRG